MSKIISFCGSPNSGKTTTALKVARELAKRQNPETKTPYNVVYLSTDYTVPALPAVFPCRKIIRSLSYCLTEVEISRGSIFASAMTIDNVSNIMYLGFKDGENSSSFPMPPITKAEALFMNLRKIADYIIVDCDSFVGNNRLMEAALRTSDRVVCIFGYSLKDISYYSSSLDKEMFRLDDYHTIRCMNLKEDLGRSLPLASIIKRYGGVDYTIPFNKDLKMQELEGNLAYDCKNKKYNSIINKIVDKIEEEEEKRIDE